MEGLSQDYIVQTMYTYCKRPVYKRYQKTYNAECCICHEGSSAGRKRRLFYFVDERYFYCFNCSRSWNEINWIQEVTGKQYFDILKESNSFEVTDRKITTLQDDKPLKEVPIIPDDSVDIFDSTQLSFYNDKDIIKKAEEYARKRRLYTAVNRPKSLYVSFEDYVHKNRLIIPFYTRDGKIGSYQSRTLVGDDYPKYLTKYGEKCMYGENNVDINIPYIFVFEGPIDAMFVKNGVAIGGSTMTDKQKNFLKSCVGQEIIYVYDNDQDNKEMDRLVRNVIKQNKKIFIWPKTLQRFKDINEICTHLDIDEFPYKHIVDNTYTGVEALMKLRP